MSNVYRSKKIVIYSISYNEKRGGIIALHKLCHELNARGVNAYLWRKSFLGVFCDFFYAFTRLIYPLTSQFLNISLFRERILYSLSQRRIKRNSHYITPFFSGSITSDFIVVYPEIVSGNPYEAKNIVRWFLNKPGRRTGEINYGENELYFYFQEEFNDDTINPNSDNLLFTNEIKYDLFANKGYQNREGTCYAIRKGKGKAIEHDLNNSILIDELSLKEIAEIFNKTKTFISYDTQTFLSYLAILCDCESIVIPDPGVSIEAWQPVPKYRLGIAYGTDNIDFSKQTKQQAIDMLHNLSEESSKSIDDFIYKVNKFFVSRS
jgi:hypothetical protein